MTINHFKISKVLHLFRCLIMQVTISRVNCIMIQLKTTNKTKVHNSSTNQILDNNQLFPKVVWPITFYIISLWVQLKQVIKDLFKIRLKEKGAKTYLCTSNFHLGKHRKMLTQSFYSCFRVKRKNLCNYKLTLMRQNMMTKVS